MAKAEIKTNVMRILDKAKIDYKHYTYDGDGTTTGVEVAAMVGQDPRRVFKTLVTVGKSKNYYVFVVPVEKELNLKLAANSVGEKSIEMIKSKDLLAVAGYIHGGCSPIGMKKNYKTTVDIQAEEFDTIIFSAGKIGYQVELSLKDLGKVIQFQVAKVAE
ncbi:MAG: Cys-tRNA(Pro) deacylase [Lachnospiraceae bacterium]|nr:Cys-tRNA(Pro) deacylase [Lachnospiraceae bacterium]